MRRGLFIGLIATGLLFTASACQRYGEVSDLGYQFAKSLHSLSRRKQADRLDNFATLLNQSLEKGELSSQEGDWLQAILDDARAKRWPEAVAASRALMEAQIKTL